MIGLFLKRFWPHLVVVAAIAGAAIWLRHSGYKAGQAEREAYYGPIIAAANQLAEAQKARLTQQALDSKVATEVQEKVHADAVTALTTRADAAERAYARILQDAARRGACRDAPDPGPPAEPSGPSRESERLGELASFAREIGERAVRDAQRLAQCQDFYRAQRAISAR